jgi:hypothetical protein
MAQAPLALACRHCNRPFTQIGVIRHCPSLSCSWCCQCVNQRRQECGAPPIRALGIID